jgi:hypothetical protein
MANYISDQVLHKLFDSLLELFDYHNRSKPRWGIHRVLQVRRIVQHLGMQHYVPIIENNLGAVFSKLFVLLKTDPQLEKPEYQALLQNSELEDLTKKVSQLLDDPRLLIHETADAGSADSQDSLDYRDVLAMLFARSINLNASAIFHFQKSVSELISSARQGNREAMIALVKLDSVFIGADFVQQELLTAELSNDMTFKRRLSVALIGIRRDRAFQNKRKMFALRFLSCFGFQNRPDSDWSEFLQQHAGFKSFHDPFNLGRARLRYGLAKRQKPQKS